MSDSKLLPSASPSPPPFHQCDYREWRPTWVIIPSVYLLVFVLGSLGNGLVLWSYLDRPEGKPAGVGTCTNRRLQQSGRSSTPKLSDSSRSLTDSLIASLAAADLAFVVTLPLWAAHTALDYHWPFGKPLCQVSSYLVALNMYASVFSLTVLSMERYWVIAGRRRSSRAQGSGVCRAAWVVGSVWVVAGILALPALLLRTVREVDVGGQYEEDWQTAEEEEHSDHDHMPMFISSCMMDYSGLISAELEEDDREQAELLWTAALGLKSTLIGFLLPLIILLICYCSLGRLLSRHFGQGPRPDRRRQRRLLRVIVTLVLAFFLCWLPFHANKTLSMLVDLELLPYSCLFDRTLVAAHPYATCLGYVNSCLNPLLYACCDVAFRKRCRALLQWLWCRGRCGCGSPMTVNDDDNREQASRSSAIPSGTRKETGDGIEGKDDVRHGRD
ncbi:apelin receptor 2 [Oncorhynchus nerka]|uniref:apelin receptor 2 n=1 Tax=Oncorhynchus nerka TaxID=8023 RepID=UPI001131801D|nr:apelin receptor B-like [Oncorhynchus nerka]